LQVAMAGCGCVVCVSQSSVGVIEHWGQFASLASPGLHCLNPLLGNCLAGRLSLRVQSLDVKCGTKTKDNVFVSMICSVQFRVIRQHADDAFYKLQNPKEQIQSYVFDVVRAFVPRMMLDDVFEQKNEIAKAVSEELEKVMGAYGYSIEQTLIVDIIPEKTVRRAMNEINAAQRMRAAAIDRAEAEKILQVKKAEGEAEAKYLNGHGIARQRQAITEGLRESVLQFSNSVAGTTPKDVMDLVLITQYFDTMKDIAGSENTAVFFPHEAGHFGDITQQIRDGMLQGDASTA